MRWLFFQFVPLFYALATAYNLTQMTTSVHLSGAAYCDKYINATEIYDRDTDAKGFVGLFDDTWYVAIRGSSSVANWEDDFEVRLVEYKECDDCKVHRGFYQSALALTAQTVALLPKGCQVIVTGHSYGAAVAQLLAVELINTGYIVHVYNFGQPRVCNAEGAKHINSKLTDFWRVTHDRDIVPHLPPMSIGYRHSSGEVFEDLGGALHTCSGDEDAKCSQQYRLIQTRTDDHLYYLGFRVTCDYETVV